MPPALSDRDGGAGTGWLWLAPIGWMALIFLVSSQPFSSNVTRSVLASFMLWFFPSTPADVVETANVVLRKLGHAMAFAILSLAWYFPLRRRFGAWGIGPALAVFGLCVLYAALDEWYQGFVPGRTASSGDASIDAAGAALAQLALLLRRKNAHD